MMREKNNHIIGDEKQEKIAIVGTPCQILAAYKMDKFSEYQSPIELKIGLFCMENFSYTFMKELLKEHDIYMKDVLECRIEKNYVWFYLTEDRVFKIPLKEVKRCIRRNCQVCMDLTSEFSDLSVGSVGSPEGWSTVIVRTDKGLEFIDAAERDNYLKTKPISESGLKIMERLAGNKKSENIAEIKKREEVGRPVIYRRGMSIDEFREEVSACQFDDLKGDVIDIGACVLCGACVLTCPEDLIEIKDRKPELTGKCKEDCNVCYVACPRTYIPDDTLSKEADKRPFGDYIKIMSVKAPMISGQDGGVATALLSYALSHKLVDNVVVVDKSRFEPWKPEPKLTDNIAEVLEASGTKYAACPIFKSLKNYKDKSETEVKGGV
jgi:coenzyme F420 hydrogenase subunit beta